MDVQGKAMTDLRETIFARLRPIVGLKFWKASRAADMIIFQFGGPRQGRRATVGEYCLHVQCPWRIEAGDEIFTGRWDLWSAGVATDDLDWDAWDYEDGNLQDRRLASLLGKLDHNSKFGLSHDEPLVVDDVDCDKLGGITISLSGGYVIRVFPCGTRSEDWRIFQPATDNPHFVIAGGAIEPEDEE